MGLREIESTLPPGFRFFPSDEELVCHYLSNKILQEEDQEDILNHNMIVSGGGGGGDTQLVDVDLHTIEPWELPDAARSRVNEWYFFSFRDRKYSTGSRANRATKTGYWKATGKDRTVLGSASATVVAGMRKTLVFYTGRAPHGVKTSWVMHEFRLHHHISPPPPTKEDWVLCRVFNKRKVVGENYHSSSSSAGADAAATSTTTSLSAARIDWPPLAAVVSTVDGSNYCSYDNDDDVFVSAGGCASLLHHESCILEDPVGSSPSSWLT